MCAWCLRVGCSRGHWVKLQVVVSHHIGAGNEYRTSAGAVSAPTTEPALQAPYKILHCLDLLREPRGAANAEKIPHAPRPGSTTEGDNCSQLLFFFLISSNKDVLGYHLFSRLPLSLQLNFISL